MVERDANKGLGVVYWSIILTVVILFALAGVLWWYDGYMLHGH